jgi:hypothetical protein
MDVPTVQEKSEQILLAQPKAHQNKFANLNKMVPTDPLKMIAFFEQCQATDKVASILEKITKDKQPKERKTVQLPVAHSQKSSYHQHCSRKYCNYLLGEVRMNVRVLVLGSTSTHKCRSTGTRVGVLVLFTYF